MITRKGGDSHGHFMMNGNNGFLKYLLLFVPEAMDGEMGNVHQTPQMIASPFL